MYTLCLVTPEGPLPVKVLSSTPTNVGRGPTNDVIVPDDMVSWHHAVIWVESDAVWLRDSNTTNGTFLDEQRVRGAERVAPGRTIRLGTRVTLFVRGEGTKATAQALVVEDLGSGTRFPVRGDRFHIGSAPDADLAAPGPDRAATINSTASAPAARAATTWYGSKTKSLRSRGRLGGPLGRRDKASR